MRPKESAALYFKLLILSAMLLLSPAVKAQAEREKLYLHLDKFSYLAGDTLWFKAYLLEEPYLMASAKSGIFYAELVNDENKVVKRMKFPARYGLGWGSISLNENYLATGSYLLRAYTSWMLNFGPQAVYTTSIYLTNTALPATGSTVPDRPLRADPVAARLVANQRLTVAGQLNVSLSTDRTTYRCRDSIALRLHVTDTSGRPVQGSFSLAVTDDNQVSLNKATHTDLNTYMLSVPPLTEKAPAGQKEMPGSKFPTYRPEPEFTITGRVKSAFKGSAGAKVRLFAQRPLLFMDTVAGPDGSFVFRNIPMSEAAVYKIQAVNHKDKSFFVNLEVDEWLPPVFDTLPKGYFTADEFTDTTFKQKIRKALALKQQRDKLSGKLLDEVNIEARKIIRGSYNLNGPGGADQTLTEKEILKHGKQSLYSLLLEQVPGLGTGGYSFPPSNRRKFGLKISGQLVKVIIDGIDLDQSYEYWQATGPDDDASEGMQERFLHLKSNLELFTAEDVKGIEVMHSASYNIKYNRKFLSQAETRFRKNGTATGVGGVSGIDYTYIEITTRSGKGPFMKPGPGTYLYKPLAFSLPQKFNAPKYVTGDATGNDIRSTLHWEPNVVTNEKGEATVSFYAADLPATYTVTVNGSDMNGRFGAITKPAWIKISP